jgi:putative transposase
MSRKRRVWIHDQFYHIVCRGNRREPIFLDADDFHAFCYMLQKLHEEIFFEMASYCLMTNHYHLQMRSPEIPFSKLMALLNKRYARYFNTKYRFTGHVYEKRFFDKIVYDEVAMIDVSHYIHLNPVEANIVKRPEDYPWSSYHLIINPDQIVPSYMNTNILLNYFEGTLEEKIESYKVTGTPRSLSN